MNGKKYRKKLSFTLIRGFLLITFLFSFIVPKAQTNLLLNGGFEDVNTCTEYTAECGVEAWFYLKDVKAQMLGNETNTQLVGTNSFGIFYNWVGYTNFVPVIGTILPCGLQKGNRYTFKGTLSARLHPRLLLQPGICLGEKFYVPKRGFSNSMHPDSITSLTPTPGTAFYQFEYGFVADGNERYLTFGTYIREDTVVTKKKINLPQTVSLVLDNFQLIPENKNEIACPDFMLNKNSIYNYNYRHKEMDYSLYGKGEISVSFKNKDSNAITQLYTPPIILKPDTLELGDVLFDFNKAELKPGAITILNSFFKPGTDQLSIDTIIVEGHTDSIGTVKRNNELSLQRCESIREWLLLNNIVPAEAIKIKSFGKSRPVADNRTPEGRALNRRVELIIFRKQKPL